MCERVGRPGASAGWRTRQPVDRGERSPQRIEAGARVETHAPHRFGAESSECAVSARRDCISAAMDARRSTPDLDALLLEARWLEDLARRLVRDPNEADDVVQETFVAAMRSPPREGSLRAWLAHVARNVVLERGRSESARARRERSVARREGFDGGSDALERAEAHQRLVAAVIALDEPWRETLLLHFFERMPAAVIAARMRTPESTVATRITRGVELLRQRFQREDGSSWALALAPLLPELTDALAQSAAAASAAKAAASVVAKGATNSAASALVGSKASSIGGGLVGTWTKFAVVVALVALCAWTSWSAFDDTSPSDSTEDAHVAVALPTTSVSDASAMAELEVAVKRESADVPSASTVAGDRANLDVHVRWSDGTPASDIGVVLHEWSSPAPRLPEHELRTDPNGVARFVGLVVGLVRISLDRCDAGNDRPLVAGETMRVDVTIPTGLEITGIVVDEDDRPVADARLWLSSSGLTLSGLVAGTSGADGRFSLRDVSSDRGIAALHDRYAPSSIVDLPPSSKDGRRDVTLRLVPSIGPIAGIVRDGAARPVEGARVLVMSKLTSSIDEAGRRITHSFPKLLVRTAKNGSFRIDGAPPDPFDLVVRAHGFAPWRLAGRKFERDRIEISLQREAVVFGRIVDADGVAVQRAAVWSGERFTDVNSCRTNSGADGSYRLTGLPSAIQAVHVETTDRGNDERTLTLRAGTEVEWNVVLKANAPTSGRVVDADGKPVAGWDVKAVDGAKPGRWLREAQTDADGRFVLENWPDAANAVEVRERWSIGVDYAALETGVTAGRDDLVIVVPRDALRSASVTGRVVDEHGEPLVDAQVSVSSKRMGFGLEEKPSDAGRFRSDRLRPGTYRLYVTSAGRPAFQSDWFDLAIDETRDLGDVVVARGGAIEVELRVTDGVVFDANDVRVMGRRIDGEERFSFSFELEGQRARRSILVPGEYEIVLTGGRIRRAAQRVVVAPDAVASVVLEARPGTERMITFELEPGRKHDLEWTLTDLESGEVLVRDTYTSISVSPFPVLAQGLRVARYEVAASTSTGASSRVVFDVASLEPTSDEVLVRLR